jgi:hypothetical protein
MRRKKNGEQWFMDLSAQEQAAIVAAAGKHPALTTHDALLSLACVFLGDVELLAPQCKCADALEIVTARAALRNLVEYLERNK